MHAKGVIASKTHGCDHAAQSPPGGRNLRRRDAHVLWLTEEHVGPVRCSDQEEETFMILTILDPRSGQTVTVQVEGVPAVRQPVLAQVIPHLRCVAKSNG